MNSAIFDGRIGQTYTAEEFSRQNYLFDAGETYSDGSWAFCRFDGGEIRAARFGFQKGGFNILDRDTNPQKSLLQLHLELVTKDGAVLWIPTGMYNTDCLTIRRDTLSIELNVKDLRVFSISGWPDIRWYFRSIEGDAEADLEFTVSKVTVLPDCVLPFCTFAMWEAVADVRGTIRYKDSKTEVKGKVFYDHPRILNAPTGAAARRSYLFTPLYFDDGGAFFCYYADDKDGKPIPYYCFGAYVEKGGSATYAVSTRLTDISFDKNNLPDSWKIIWTGGDYEIRLQVSVNPVRILKSWGSPAAPADVKNFWVYPLVLDCDAVITTSAGKKTVKGYGLAEYFNADYWQ